MTLADENAATKAFCEEDTALRYATPDDAARAVRERHLVVIYDGYEREGEYDLVGAACFWRGVRPLLLNHRYLPLRLVGSILKV